MVLRENKIKLPIYLINKRKLLAMRGFWLVQIGFAECVFHVISLLFEIPSEVISDIIGRKKTIILSKHFFAYVKE